jgi:4-amino-4-deoxy-L-arabinose transferase-like glycosyltransferase
MIDFVATDFNPLFGVLRQQILIHYVLLFFIAFAFL